jgi:hypothetical protein
MCPDSGRALLRKRGVPFAERMIDSPEASTELKRLAGTDKVPVLAVGRDLQAGFDQLKWDRLLDAAGYPAQSSLTAPYSTNPGQSLVARSQGAAAPAKATTAP